jgi:hypothetical protein
MKKIICLFLFFSQIIVKAQLLVYTVAGSDTATSVGDGRPATNAGLGTTEGIWLDGSCNLYISDLGDRRIRKVTSTTGIITTIAGGLGNGYSGDGGPATNAKIDMYGLWVDALGDVYFADPNSGRIRIVNVTTGIINTFAGGGSSLGDGGQAKNALLNNPANVYGDKLGNIYIAESTRRRKVNAITGIISTIAGNGITGYSGDGGPATNAKLSSPVGMIFDAKNNLYIAERGNAVIRKIDSTTGIITTVVGTTPGYSGDNGPATAAQISNLNSIAIDFYNDIIIGDLQNNVLRKVDAITGIITTIAGVGPTIIGSSAEGAAATAADIHPEFIYLDLSGNIYFSQYLNPLRKITHYYPGLPNGSNYCGETGIHDIEPSGNTEMKIFPNPTTNKITIKSYNAIEQVLITNTIGQIILQQSYNTVEKSKEVDVGSLSNGIYFVKVNGVYAGKFAKK